MILTREHLSLTFILSCVPSKANNKTVFPRHTSVVVVLVEPSTNSTRGILSPGLKGRLGSDLKSRDINGLGCVLQ